MHDDLSDMQRMEDLPEPARRYVERLAELCGVKLAMVGVGGREATIVLENPFLA